VVFESLVKLMARMMEERFRVAQHMFQSQRKVGHVTWAACLHVTQLPNIQRAVFQVLRAQWQLLQEHATEMKHTLPMLAHLVAHFYSVSKRIPKSAGKSVFRDQIDDMLRSLFVEFPNAKSHDAWAAIVWYRVYYPKPLKKIF
jgi:REP element-mobilizing transposase RayT